MADDAYYRQVLAQMQSEFTRAVTALEKQVTALTRHNELLKCELAQSKALQTEATRCVTQLENQLKTQVSDADKAQQDAANREKELTLEISALKSLLQQEQDYWTRYDQAGKDDRDRLTRQVAEAKAEAMQRREQNRTLKNEMQALRARVETAVATSNSFEQRLLTVVKEKQQSLQEAEKQLTHYRKKVHEKRAQNKYLTEALVRLQEQRQSSTSSESPTQRVVTKVSEAPTPMETVSKPAEVPAQRRMKKRELTLPEEIKSATANVTTSSRMYKSKRLGSSRTGTSPTSSSPEISPRSARSAPYRRPPSVATTTPTTSDGNSFNSNNSGSLRSLRHVTGRRITSRSSSDSDNIDVSPRTSARRSPTGRLERELNGLRQKLDSCMADAARW